MEGARTLRQRVDDAVIWAIQGCDTKQALDPDDFHDVLVAVTQTVLATMEREQRSELQREDYAAMERLAGEMVSKCMVGYADKLRFRRFDRVLCRTGGDRGWTAGTIQAILESDPEDNRRTLPYVVKCDPPNGRLISVPHDENGTVLAEVCFGQRAGALWFTVFSAPFMRSAAPQPPRRFAVGDRVACAVEDGADEYTEWAAGTVTDVDYSIEDGARALYAENDWADANLSVPYRVALDAHGATRPGTTSVGGNVLVHRDEHWLVRDLALQPEGARQGPRGTRQLKRFVKRTRADDGEWEVIDHTTRQLRSCAAPESDEDDDE